MSFTLIQTVTVGSGGQASIDLNSIPATFTDLVVVASLRAANTVSQWQNIKVTFNNSGSGYTYRTLFGYDGGTTGSGGATSSTEFQGFYAVYGLATANTFSNGSIYIPNYRTSANKSVSFDSVTEHNGTQAIGAIVAGVWANSAAITSIKFEPAFAGNFLQHSSISLYGITAGSSGGVVVS